MFINILVSAACDVWTIGTDSHDLQPGSRGSTEDVSLHQAAHCCCVVGPEQAQQHVYRQFTVPVGVNCEFSVLITAVTPLNGIR